MTAKILDGNALAQKLRADFKTRAEALLASRGTRPGLAVILVGEDPAHRSMCATRGTPVRRPVSTPRRSAIGRCGTAAGLRRIGANSMPTPKYTASWFSCRCRGTVRMRSSRRLPRKRMSTVSMPRTWVPCAGPPALHPLHALRRAMMFRERRPRPQRQGSGDPRALEHRWQADGDAAAAMKCNSHHLPFADPRPGLPARRADILVAALGKARFVTAEWSSRAPW